MDDLTIRLRMDRSEADKAAAAFHAAERQRQTETAKAQADAARQAAREQATALKTSEKAARDAAREQAKAARDAAREQANAAREAERAVREAVRQQAAEARKAAQEQARLDNRVLSETEIRERSKREIYRKTNQQRIQELTKAHRTEMDKARESEAAANRLMGSATSAVSSFAGQMVGLSSVSSIMNEVFAGFQRTRDAIFNSTELMQEFRESLLELAALKDRMGDTSAEAVDTLRVQAQTGQKRQDVVDLQAGFMGMAEIMVGEGRGKKITADEAQKAMIGLGRMQAVQGADAGSYGELGGIILQNATKPMTADEVTKEAAAAYALFQPGRYDSFGQFIDMYGKASPFINSGVVSNRQAMALTSAFSISRGDEAATAVRQFLQATTGSQGAGRKVMGIDPDQENIAAGQYLANLGLKDVIDPVVIGKAIAADVDRMEAAAKARGQNFNPVEYLKSQGYGNQESQVTLLDFRGSLKTGAWGEFEKLANDPNLGSGVMAEADARLASDPGLVGRQARSAEAMQKMLAATPQEEWMSSMRRLGYTRLGGERAGLKKFEDIETSSWYHPMNWLDGQRQRVREATNQMIMETADRMGVDYQAVTQVGSGGEGTYKSLTDEEAFRLSRELAGKGANFGTDTMTVSVSRFEAAVDRFAQAQQPAATPPPLQGAPRQPPAAPR